MRKLATVLATVLLLVACEGKIGPTGPAGPQGATGPQGPAGAPGAPGAPGALNRADWTGVFTTTSVSAPIPAAALANGKLPAIACYLSDTGVTWLAVAQTPTGTTAPYCGLTSVGTGSAGITFVNGVIGWHYYIIAMW